MARTDNTATSSDDDARSTRRLLERLTAATKRRRRLSRGTPEHSRALDTEQRLADGIWRRVSVRGPFADAVVAINGLRRPGPDRS
jgi:hypothetical protein